MISLTKAERVASSIKLPPHRTRRRFQSSSPGSIERTLVARGRSSSEARWAMTSLPRSLPGAITAPGSSWATSWARASARASGA